MNYETIRCYIANLITGIIVASLALMLFMFREPSSSCFKIGDALALFGACGY
jgi:hypothetical protein